MNVIYPGFERDFDINIYNDIFGKLAKVREKEIYKAKKKNLGKCCLLQEEVLKHKYTLNFSNLLIEEEINKWK
jgi:hypothetical protein